MQVKKQPTRTCVGCREIREKRELIRVVKNKENEISLDFTGKKSGRGAYICKSKECLDKAIKTKALERVFDCKIEDEIIESLKREI